MSQLEATDVRVAAPFANNAVLQQGMKIPVWGTAGSEQSITVRFGNQLKTTHAAKDGSWQVELAPLSVNSVGESLHIESGEQRIHIRGVVVGEVWYASGQSNMQMKLESCFLKLPELKKVTEAASGADIRILRVDEPAAVEPANRLTKPATWQTNSAETRIQHSAVAWFFANQIHQKLKVPVGIIEGSWGGKPIEGFIPRKQFEKEKALRRILELADQDKLDALAKIEGGVIVRNAAGMPGQIFNARVSPIAPYAVRGVLWYQGESNAGRGEDPRNYRFKMRALVEGWRDAWKQPDLPFYFVQLPAFNDTATGWIRMREEQRLSLEIQNTGMAVTIDLLDDDIHPANKLDVGNRLAWWALQHAYKIDVPCSGPLFRSAVVEGGAIRVSFDYSSSGLMIAGKDGIGDAKPILNADLAHFELASSDGRWYSAEASIEEQTVIVRSKKVSHPVAVRYACQGNPQNANLYNKDGLPASPFCSELKLLPWQSQQPK